MVRLGGGLALLHERQKGLMQNVFRLPVAQTQRPAVQQQFRPLGLVQNFAPLRMSVAAHVTSSLDRHQGPAFCIKKTPRPLSRLSLKAGRSTRRPVQLVRDLPSAVRALPDTFRGLPSRVRDLPSAAQDLQKSVWDHPKSVWDLPKSVWDLQNAVWDLPKSVLDFPKSVWDLPNDAWEHPNTAWESWDSG